MPDKKTLVSWVITGVIAIVAVTIVYPKLRPYLVKVPVVGALFA